MLTVRAHICNYTARGVKMNLAHKIELDPTCKQAKEFRKACGVSRYTWNWALEKCNSHYEETGKNINLMALKKQWNAEKPEWVYESCRDANSQPFSDLNKAWSNFFAKRSRKPKFKSKHRSKSSFYVSNDKFTLDGNTVRLPKIGWVRMTEALRFPGKVLSGTVSERSGRWYLSVNTETEIAPKHGDEVIGIDFGLKSFMTLSTGEKVTAPEPLKQSLALLRRRSRQHSRKVRGSNNRRKSGLRLAKTHKRISDQRQDFIHKETSKLVARTKLLVIEDLSLTGMKKLWGRKVSDLGISETVRQLKYKCGMNDCGLLQVDRWFPSSQLCSCCGGRQKLTLGQRVYDCQNCGKVTDRDVNAANNLYTVGLAGINAWGHEGSDYRHTLVVKPSWMSQELNQCPPVGTH